MIDSPFNPKGPRASTRSKDNMSLKEAIESLMRVYKLQNKYDETYIIAHWEEIMGKPIAARTTKIFIKDKKKKDNDQNDSAVYSIITNNETKTKPHRCNI